MTTQQDNKHLLVVQDIVKFKVCVNKCKADPTRMFCMGCGRTMKEITEYGKNRRTEKTTTTDSRRT